MSLLSLLLTLVIIACCHYCLTAIAYCCYCLLCLLLVDDMAGHVTYMGEKRKRAGFCLGDMKERRHL